MRDFSVNPYTRDYDIQRGQIKFTKDIRNNIYFSLAVNLGQWAFAPKFGSRLYLLPREKALPRLEGKAKKYCEEALKWIIGKSRADKIDVMTQLDKENMRMLCLIEAYQAGKKITYEYFVEVR